MEYLNLDIVVDIDSEESLKAGASKVVSKVKPEWPVTDFKFKIFTDGISNKLIGIYVQNKNEMVLVRVYGAKTELIIDRQAEIRNMLVLHKAGCGCQLYAKFTNGLAYEYLPGDILNIESVKHPQIYPKVAETMAKMHLNVDLGPTVPKQPCMWNKLRMFLDQYPDSLNDARLQAHGISKDKLSQEVQMLQDKLTGVSSPIVFTHNDLLLANIVIDGEKVSFIDYEYGDYNYQECDVANHFDEMAGVENMDFVKHYPTQAFQLDWIKAYLAAYGPCDKPDEKQIWEFYVNVNKFSLCYHMMWGLWGLVQASISKIDFDFVAFALGRLNEYFRVRDERINM